MMRNPLLNHLRNAVSTMLLVLGPVVLLNGQSPSIDGRVWFNTPSNTTANFNGLSSFGSDYAVAVGVNGTVQRYSDGVWSAFPGGSDPWSGTALSSVAVISSDNIWVGSNSSTASLRGVSHWNGNEWSAIMHPASSATNQRVLGLWADPTSGYVFTALQNGRVTFYNGSVWSNLTIPGGTADMLAVHGSGLDNVWAVGSGGQVYQSTTAGASWTVHNVGDYAAVQWHGVYTLASDRAWMVGGGGEIAFWNGETFSVTKPTNQILRDVYAIDENHVYAVGTAPGSSGTFLYFDGTDWSPMDLDPEVTQDTWYAIDGDGTRIWLAGNNGTILTSMIPEPSQVALAVVILLPVLMRLVRRRRTVN